MPRRPLSAIALYATLACSCPPPPLDEGPPTLCAVDAPAIELADPSLGPVTVAAFSWLSRHGLTIDWTITTMGWITVHVEPAPPADWPAGWIAAAHVRYMGGIIYACDITLLAGLYDDVVLAHELGHCLGLPHHPDPRDLMYWASAVPYDEITLCQDSIDWIAACGKKYDYEGNLTGETLITLSTPTWP